MLLHFLLRVLVASFLLLQALGQNSVQTFNWKFRTDFVSTSLPACFRFDIIAFPNLKNATAGNFSGIPPYYMMAFPEGGQPITTFVGDSNNTLSWIPTHPIGTKLILQLVDSTGSTGGTAGSVFEVVENSNSGDCIASRPPGDFTISSNVTQDGKATLETCHPWRLNINGGRPPYTVVLDARNSPVLTNITVPPSDNAAVFINRADPGSVLFAGVVDSLGRWADGTQFVSTVGSTNITCPGRNSITEKQEVLDQQEAEQNATQKSKHRTSIIIGVVVSVVVLLLIVGAVGLWLYMRKKKSRQMEEGDQDVTPRQFVNAGSSGQVLSINSFMGSPTTTPSPGKSSFNSPDTQGPPYTESLTVDTNRISSGSASGQTPVSGANLRSRPSFASFPASSVRRSKAQEAALDATTDSNHPVPTRGSNPPGSSGQPIWPTRSGSLQGNRLTTASMETEVIYQHQDGGQVVRELPPPYVAPPDVNNSTAESERRT